MRPRVGPLRGRIAATHREDLTWPQAAFLDSFGYLQRRAEEVWSMRATRVDNGGMSEHHWWSWLDPRDPYRRHSDYLLLLPALVLVALAAVFALVLAR
jgi:hypothetical protein